MENEKITNCNQCPNQCPADALQCGRGRRYFEQLENPDMKNTDAGEHHRHGEGHHGKDEGHQHDREHSREYSREHSKGHDREQNREHNGGYGKGDNLYGLMRACGHYLHHSGGRNLENGGENQLFAVLDEGEQESLKALLKKLIESWEQ